MLVSLFNCMATFVDNLMLELSLLKKSSDTI